ncbi:LysR family transcriptional regulator [Asticcacaulis sp. DXS10W]|uniref:LysR family transcriptional regulator n=1 Tax=Asticcacaulis currens TaxID=2984210 RepID=A0ABT5IDF7_9CAUL|nr:LysR family transcriptional regulator [Asticcacaulis currens]MDC7694220.1 LysR family transcriptional regulator [Asticcacaulis currens]
MALLFPQSTQFETGCPKMRTPLRVATDLDIFAEIARSGGFRRAAVHLGMPVSRLSDRISSLEARMQVRLFHRSTRSVALTEAGLTLFRGVEPVLASLDYAVEAACVPCGEPTGRLRINAAPPAADLVLPPLLSSFLASHPRIDVELTADDALVDVIGAGYDVGIRYEENLAPDVIALPLGKRQRYALVASPKLLATVKMPASPADIADFPGIRHRFSSGQLLEWEFERDGEIVRVIPRTRLVTGSVNAAISAALDGLGCYLTISDYVAGQIASGDLVNLLSDWLPDFSGPFLYYYSKELLPPAVKAFIEHVKKSHRHN